MTLKGMEGCEDGSAEEYSIQSSVSIVATTDLDMDHDYCMEMLTASSYATKILTADTMMYGAVLFRLKTLALTQVFSFFSGASLLGNLAVTAEGNLAIYAGASALLATSDVTIAAEETQFIEFYYKLADSPDGAFVVKLNGITVLDYTGDTKPGDEATFTAFRLGYAGVSGRNANGYFDNIILDDAGYVGELHIQGCAVTGAGTTSQLSASPDDSSDDDYECINEVPPSDTDYLYSNTAGHVSTFATANLTGTIVSIKGVKVSARVKKNGAATPTNVELALRSGTTNYFGADNAVGTSFASINKIWELDPDTSAAFLEAGFNAAEIGVKVTA